MVVDEGSQTKEPLRKSTRLGPALGNFSVQYNFQCIAIVLTIAVRTSTGSPQRSWVDEQSKSSVFVGCILGQCVMGYVGDVIGRSRAMEVTLGLAAIAALASAVLPWGPNAVLYGIIVVCRFVLGFGLGGVYPLSATQAAEAVSELRKGAVRAGSAFFWQTPGSLGPYIVAIVLRAALGSQEQSLQWRLILGLGALPPALLVGIKVLEQAEDQDVGRGTSATNASLVRVLREPQYWRWMLGTGGGWLVFDIAYYGFTLMGPAVVASCFSNDKSIENNAWQQMLALGCALPAVPLTIYWIHLGYEPKTIQVVGFVIMAASFIAFFLLRLSGVSGPVLYGAYCVINFAMTMGPNVTTFVLPAATYPKATRASLNGLSSALGKLGAVIGTECLPELKTSFGLNGVLLACALISLLGALISQTCVDRVLTTRVSNLDALLLPTTGTR